MQKIILYVATSLDGFIATKDGSVKWLDKYNESGEDIGYEEFLRTINTVVMGNTTYRQILGFDCEYPYKGLKNYVFTNKKGSDEHASFVNGDVEEFINGLDEDHNIWLVGGANLINQFLKKDLIDEFRIFVMPEILGSGIRLFAENNKETELTLIKTKQFKSGMTELRYERAATGS